MLNKARKVSEEDISDQDNPPTRRMNSFDMADDKRPGSNSFNDSNFNETGNLRKNYDLEPTNKKADNSFRQKSFTGKMEEGKQKNGEPQKMSL